MMATPKARIELPYTKRYFSTPWKVSITKAINEKKIMNISATGITHVNMIGS
ncbi:hypothetical protein D9M71_827110 [compost metagenome]